MPIPPPYAKIKGTIKCVVQGTGQSLGDQNQGPCLRKHQYIMSNTEQETHLHLAAGADPVEASSAWAPQEKAAVELPVEGLVLRTRCTASRELDPSNRDFLLPAPCLATPTFKHCPLLGSICCCLKPLLGHWLLPKSPVPPGLLWAPWLDSLSVLILWVPSQSCHTFAHPHLGSTIKKCK